MKRRSTERFLFALLFSSLAVVIAVLIGQAAVVVMITPWFVLLAAGVAMSSRQAPDIAVSVDNDRVMVDDLVEVSASVSGFSSFIKAQADPIWKFNSEETSAAAPAAESSVADRNRRATISFTIPAAQWGMFDVGRVHLEVLEPFGLMRWTGTVSDPTPIRVHPTPRQLRAMVAPRLVRRTTGTHGSRLAERGIEYADLRQFGAGDSLRDINWRVSARSPDLWVSQRHPDRATEVVLLLDSFVETGHDAPAVVGLAVEAAIAVAESHLAVTDRVGLVELGGLVRWVVPGTGALQLQRLIDALLATGLFASAANRDLALISPRALPPRSMIIALSPLLDERFTDALLVLAGRGHDIAVIECDPALGARGGEVQSAPKDHKQDTAQNKEDDRSMLSELGWRMWQAERSIMRDELAQHGVTPARWQADQPIDIAVHELIRRRSVGRGAARQAVNR